MTDDELTAIEQHLNGLDAAAAFFNGSDKTIAGAQLLLAEVRRLRALCRKAAARLEDVWDDGPPDEGWQSDELSALVGELRCDHE